MTSSQYFWPYSTGHLVFYTSFFNMCRNCVAGHFHSLMFCAEVTSNPLSCSSFFSTLTTTVIVPPKDKPCSQWITFNTDHEPVLNNAPITNEGCDNFLKRLQSTKLYLQGIKWYQRMDVITYFWPGGCICPCKFDRSDCHLRIVWFILFQF